MKRFEVSTEIGSLSVTYQKQKKVLVCLKELGISEYILCAHSWSGILACKLLEKPIKRQTLVAIEPTTKKSCLLIFQKILIQKWKSR